MTKEQQSQRAREGHNDWNSMRENQKRASQGLYGALQKHGFYSKSKGSLQIRKIGRPDS